MRTLEELGEALKGMQNDDALDAYMSFPGKSGEMNPSEVVVAAHETLKLLGASGDREKEEKILSTLARALLRLGDYKQSAGYLREINYEET